MQFKGNKKILDLHKTGFLCSQKIPAEIVLKSYDWAKQQRVQGNCIICGNHSQIEKDVFEILIKGKQPLILVLARGMKKRWEPEINIAISENRLIVISPFADGDKRTTRDKAKIRNEFIIKLADKIVIGSITEGGQLDNIIRKANTNFEYLK